MKIELIFAKRMNVFRFTDDFGNTRIFASNIRREVESSFLDILKDLGVKNV